MACDRSHGFAEPERPILCTTVAVCVQTLVALLYDLSEHVLQ